MNRPGSAGPHFFELLSLHTWVRSLGAVANLHLGQGRDLGCGVVGARDCGLGLVEDGELLLVLLKLNYG